MRGGRASDFAPCHKVIYLDKKPFFTFSLSLLYGVFPGLLGQRIWWRIRGERPEKYCPLGIMRSSFAEAAAGYSNKDSSIKKKKTVSELWMTGRKKTRELLFHSFPFPSFHALFHSTPSSAPTTTRRGFCIGEGPRLINLSLPPVFSWAGLQALV